MSSFYTNELSNKNLKETISKLKKKGIKKIVFGGGEPFLRKNIFELFELCPKDISILTNATLLNKKTINKLKKTEEKLGKIITLRISLDGLESNKELRSYDYKTILEKIKELKKQNFVVVVNTVVSPYIKKGELIRMLDILEEIGVNQWNVDIPFNEGSFKKNKLSLNLKFILKELKKIIEKYLRKDRKIRLDIVGLFCSERVKNKQGFYKCDIKKSPCNYQLHSITINPKGDILLCPSLHIPFGNIKNDLDSYRNLTKWKKFISKDRTTPKGCKNCKYINICGGGCRANALTYSRDLWGKDELSCKLMKFLEKEIIELYPKELQEQFKELLIPKFKIKRYTKESQKGIIKLFSKIYPSWKEKDLKKMVYDTKKKDHIATKLAFANNKLIGQSNIFEISKEHKIGNLGYHVHPEFRKEGIGYNLASEVIKESKINGIKKVIIQTSKSNNKSIQLAKSLGFKECQKNLPKKIRDSLKKDHVIFIKDLIN